MINRLGVTNNETELDLDQTQSSFNTMFYTSRNWSVQPHGIFEGCMVRILLIILCLASKSHTFKALFIFHGHSESLACFGWPCQMTLSHLARK